MRPSNLTVLLLALALAACGKDPDHSSAKGSESPTAPPAPSALLPTNPEGGYPAQWTGKLEKMGPSIVMQGAHKFVDGAKTVVILRSSKVDLSKYEGKEVSVSGPSAPTVEGNQIIVDVAEIQEVP